MSTIGAKRHSAVRLFTYLKLGNVLRQIQFPISEPIHRYRLLHVHYLICLKCKVSIENTKLEWITISDSSTYPVKWFLQNHRPRNRLPFGYFEMSSSASVFLRWNIGSSKKQPSTVRKWLKINFGKKLEHWK